MWGNGPLWAAIEKLTDRLDAESTTREDSIRLLEDENRGLRDRVSRLEGRLDAMLTASPMAGGVTFSSLGKPPSEDAAPTRAQLARRLDEVHGAGLSVEEMVKRRKLMFAPLGAPKPSPTQEG